MWTGTLGHADLLCGMVGGMTLASNCPNLEEQTVFSSFLGGVKKKRKLRLKMIMHPNRDRSIDLYIVFMFYCGSGAYPPAVRIEAIGDKVSQASQSFRPDRTRFECVREGGVCS